MREKLEKVGRVATHILALALVGVAVHLLLKGDSAGGGVAALMALGVAAYRLLPLVQRLEIFGLKAELRDKINEADDALSRLRNVATALGRANYLHLAWMGRWGRPPIRAIDDVAAETDRLLADLKVPADIRSQVVAPYLAMIGVDLFSIPRQLTKDLFQTFRHAVQRALTSTQEGTAEYSRLKDLDAAYSPGRLPALILTENSPDEFQMKLSDLIRATPMPADEKLKLLGFLEYTARIYAGVKEQKRQTETSERFINKYSDSARLAYNETYGPSYYPSLDKLIEVLL